VSREEVILYAACIAAIASVSGASLGLWNGFQSRKRDALSEIAAHRVRWIESLRDQTAELIAILLTNHVKPTSDGELLIRIEALVANMKLKLNAIEHKTTFELLESLRSLSYESNRREHEKGDEEFLDYLNLLPDEMSIVLKAERTRAKVEIRGKAQ